jgi:hypothetical protein
MALFGLAAANNLADVTDRERAWDNLGENISDNFPIAAHSLHLNFAANKSLIDDVSGNNLVTFSRASTGTFVGADGLIQTAASGAARFDHNPATGESLGLLMEEARTNAALYSDLSSNNVISNATQGLNAATSPDGLFTASLITATSISNNFYQATSVTSGSAYSYSIFVKAGTASYVEFSILAQIGFTDTRLTFGTGQISGQQSANLSVTAYPGGWFRVTWGFVSSATSTRGLNLRTADGTSYYAWGRQHEAGSFPTSYIPTVASTVTRAADVASMTGTNFSSWYRQDEGSFLAKIKALSPTFQQSIFRARAASGNQEMRILLGGSSAASSIYSDAGSGSGGSTPTAIGVPYSTSFAAAYKLLDFAVANATQVVTNTTGGVAISPVFTRADIGSMAGQFFNGTIARLVYYPARLPNSALQHLTTTTAAALPTTYPYSFSVTGQSILALEEVRQASTRDFVFIKGLTSAAQPRLTAAAASAASGASLRDNALLRASPVSTGDYTISGFFLDAASLRINNVSVASIATTPFAGSTATTSLLISSFLAPANFRFTQAMTSGTVLTGDRAIPIEGNDLILYAKAGQN